MSLRGHQRREFPQSVRKLAFARCCQNGSIAGTPQCESCGMVLRAGNIVYEHVQPDGLGGEPTLDNCKVFCRKICARKKTTEEDNPRMQKADRVLKKNFGLRPPRQKIASRGFAKAEPQRTASRPLERGR